MNKLKATILGIALISGTALMAQDKTGKGFEKWDANGDGGIDITEFQAMKDAHAEKRAENGKPAPEKEPDTAKQFAQIDTDGNGLLSKDEIDAKKDLAKESNKGFEKWDANGDGGIDITEFQAMKDTHAAKRAENGKPAPEKEPDTAKQFTQIDTDGNGLLSKEELVLKKTM